MNERVNERANASGNKPVADAGARARAIDPGHSFIVQAPAGSGKTELLIQRYLALLARVDEPEEIAAITFTRKAAAEMRGRVIEALQSARGAAPAAEGHLRRTWELASAVRARDAEREWRIEENVARLRIQTIDALSASLTRQMPLLSRFGAQPESVDDPGALYLEAARNLLGLLERGGGAIDDLDEDDPQTGESPVAADIARLLRHLDNDLGVAETLIARMLRYRDQWLRNLSGARDREALESVLLRVRREGLKRLCELMPKGACAELMQLAGFAAGNLAAAEAPPDSPLLHLAGRTEIPGHDEAHHPAWLGIAALLLTKENEWRKVRGLNKNIGFPPGASKTEKAAAQAMKERMAALLQQFAESEQLRGALGDVRTLPPAAYSEAQWEALGAIVRLLPRATAELWNVFAQHGQCDFTEIAQAASRALGDPDAPTDLALVLDYRIRHLLVDEFQDTSFAQYELLEKLTAGWVDGDGRTLFLVGDPMQSIYRFREAEVGLFLKARREGIGQVALEPLTLSVNFRSHTAIVAWVNETFARAMPDQDDVGAGAVSYAASVAHHDPAAHDAAGEMAHGAGATVHAHFHGELHADGDFEAMRIVEIAREFHRTNPAGTLAILVRNRPHLDAIVPALKAAGLPFRAVDIDPLGGRQTVQDLLTITRALLHGADRTAWLALLRAPWCGLTLEDLVALAETARDDPPTGAPPTLREMLADTACLARLSPDGRGRAARLAAVLEAAFVARRRQSFCASVEGVWLQLGGPACVAGPADLDDAERFFDYLQDHEAAGTLPDPAAFEAGVGALYAAPVSGEDAWLHIMTIHKAKGLEFDSVIVPGLGRAPRGQDARLVAWLERVGDDGRELLLAPIRAAGIRAASRGRGDADDGDDQDAAPGARDPIYEYIAALEARKQEHETVRLAYVAATRAKRQLHLFGSAGHKVSAAGEITAHPRARSLLAPLWPALEAHYARAALERPPAPKEDDDGGFSATPADPPPLRRLRSDWTPPPMPAGPAVAPAPDRREPAGVEFSWASIAARHTGTVVHRFLQRMAAPHSNPREAQWTFERIETLSPDFERELAQLGVAAAEVPRAAGQVRAALAGTLADARGQWLLEAHAHAASELRLTGVLDGVVCNLAIDRTFVDGEGTRWIVDYKTGAHEGASIERFLDSEEQRYRPQLQRYARLMAAFEPGRTIRLGLYFPLLRGWREWAFVE